MCISLAGGQSQSISYSLASVSQLIRALLRLGVLDQSGSRRGLSYHIEPPMGNSYREGQNPKDAYLRPPAFEELTITRLQK
jgi:hypothetical protein